MAFKTLLRPSLGSQPLSAPALGSQKSKSSVEPKTQRMGEELELKSQTHGAEPCGRKRASLAQSQSWSHELKIRSRFPLQKWKFLDTFPLLYHSLLGLLHHLGLKHSHFSGRRRYTTTSSRKKHNNKLIRVSVLKIVQPLLTDVWQLNEL